MFDHLCVQSSRKITCRGDVASDAELQRLLATARRELVDNSDMLEMATDDYDGDGEPPFSGADDFTVDHLFHPFTFEAISLGCPDYEVVTIGPKPSPEEGKVDNPEDIYYAVILENEGNPMGSVFRGASTDVYMKYYDGCVDALESDESKVEAAALMCLICCGEEALTIGEMRDSETYKDEVEAHDELKLAKAAK